MSRTLGILSAALAAVVSTGCGDSGPVEPNIPVEDIAGAYRLTALTFDPQGSLPSADVLARLRGLGKPDPTLTLLEDGSLQLLFEDPANVLLRLVDGSFLTTPGGVDADFGTNAAYRSLLLSRRMLFSVDGAGSLVFDGSPPDGLPQSDLIRLVTEWAGEPLTNPVPGSLRVVFGPIS